MEDVTLKEAKEHLEELVERARRGEDVRIVDAHLGIIQLQLVEAAKTVARRPRRLGLLEGKDSTTSRRFL